MKKVLISIACLSFILMASCEKEEGIGGTSTITGKVKVREYNDNFTHVIGEYYAGDQDVYIIYGNDSVYSDKFTTSYDGTYRFEYLREGNYKVFAYSLDSAAFPLDKETEVMKEVTITGKDQLIQVEDILMISSEKVEGTGGTSTITGKVKVREYNGNFTYLIGEYYAGDEDVYIIYGNDSVYSDKFTTSYDGTYRFEYLREGKYKVFAYSLDSAAYPLDKKTEVMKEVTITEKDQVVQVEDIIILD
jgi:hypothetical protein